ncbi:MAG: asparaginase [Actinomycetota bacterium]
MPPVPLVQVVRSGFVESVHVGSVAVVDADGKLIASAGDPHRVTYARSAMKPLQAAVSLTLADEDLPAAQVAVMSASHNGEPVHLDAVRSVLGRAGLDFDALRTPPAFPLDPEAARAAEGPRPELHNCSGKHSGMLLASKRQGYPLDAYPEPNHPLQRSVLDAVTRAAGSEPVAIGVDGCGVPVHALPLSNMARIYASLAGPGLVTGGDRVVEGMRSEPYLVAGRNRVCTAVMEAVPDVIVKVGAEGLVCAGLLGRGMGVAIKVDDGNARATDPAMVHALRLLDALGEGSLAALERFARPPVLGGGRPVGSLLPLFDLERP